MESMESQKEIPLIKLGEYKVFKRGGSAGITIPIKHLPIFDKNIGDTLDVYLNVVDNRIEIKL